MIIQWVEDATEIATSVGKVLDSKKYRVVTILSVILGVAFILLAFFAFGPSKVDFSHMPLLKQALVVVGTIFSTIFLIPLLLKANLQFVGIAILLILLPFYLLHVVIEYAKKRLHRSAR